MISPEASVEWPPPLHRLLAPSISKHTEGLFEPFLRRTIVVHSRKGSKCWAIMPEPTSAYAHVYHNTHYVVLVIYLSLGFTDGSSNRPYLYANSCVSFSCFRPRFSSDGVCAFLQFLQSRLELGRLRAYRA